MDYNRLNNILGWFCGLIATTVYILTVDPYNSWWDTGEFIASAYKLQVVHQPGAPLFLLLQNVMSNLGFGDSTRIAYFMNVGSAICSGMTVVFLFWTITAIARKIVMAQYREISKINIFLILASGLVGALAYAFTDTFWYSAVESEVYAMSSLCTAAVLWLMFKWESRADSEDHYRWLILIAFVMGLSIGVHLLNLLTIPAFALMIYFRKVSNITWRGVLKSLLIGVGVLAFVLWGIIQYSVKIAGAFEIFFVNDLGFGFGSGVIFFVVLLISALVYGLYVAHRKGKVILQVALLSISFIYFGYASYSMIVIRAATNISLNNNAPDNVFSFLGYLSREQYQSEPLIKGPSFDSKVIESNPVYSYRKDKNGYTKIVIGQDYTYDKEQLFPRLYSDKHADVYKYYLGKNDASGVGFFDNVKFFVNYQFYHMYARYFLWNFVGRQNDNQSHVSELSGNWLSGIQVVDKLRLSGEGVMDAATHTPSRNTYYFLPLILGLLGFIFHITRKRKDAVVLGLLFFFTGLAIVLYLNQSPLQPRERDYAYAGSFYMFAIWIGLSVLAIYSLITKYLNKKIAMTGAFLVATIAGPVLLISQNWDDHDRSNREWTRDMAYNYLESCEPNAILFTYADNDTFPLWYLQEVEGVRKDVRIVNLSYLQSDWYFKQSMKDINDAQAVPIDIDSSKIEKGVRDGLFVHEIGVEGYTDVDTILDILLSDDTQNMIQMRDGKFANFLPTRKLQLSVDKDSVVKNKVVPADWTNRITDMMQWDYNKDFVSRAELAMLAILKNNNWERPIYFANMLSADNFMGLDKYLVNEGLVYKLMPVDRPIADNNGNMLVNVDTLYKNITEKYKWGNIKNLKHFDTDYKNFVSTYFYEYTINEALDSLLKSGDTNRAGNIARLAYENMPKEVISAKHVYQNSFVVDTLFKAKEKDKAIALANRDLQYLEKQLNYIHAVGSKLTAFDQRDVEVTVDTLDRYRSLVMKIGDRDLITRVERLEKKYFVN